MVLRYGVCMHIKSCIYLIVVYLIDDAMNNATLICIASTKDLHSYKTITETPETTILLLILTVQPMLL